MNKLPPATHDRSSSESGIHSLNLGDQQLQKFFDEAAVPIGICDQRGDFVACNQAYAGLLGYTPGELHRTNFERIVHPEDLIRNRELVEDLTEGDRSSFEVVNRYVHKEGHEIWVHKYVTILRDESGEATHMIGLVTDVSERKQAELRLQQNEEYLRAILNSATDAIVTIDRYGTILGLNPSTKRMFGYRESELVGQKVNLLMPSPHSEEHGDYISNYLETGEKKIIGIGRELEAVRKDGTVIPVELTVTEVDHLQVFTGFLRDLSEEKREQERLIEAERLAGLGEAMAALVHENRNALARVQANLRMLSRRLRGDRDLEELVEAALAASNDLGRQYEEVREYSAPIRLKCACVNLKDLVDEAWGQLTELREGRKTTLRISLNEPEFHCRGDRFKLVNAFRNILDNALAATPADPVMIDVELSLTSLQGKSAVKTGVRDYGAGLDPEVADTALDAFVSTKTRGTGLGLAIVKRIVEAHGGEVTIAPVNDNRGGAVVSVILPAEARENC